MSINQERYGAYVLGIVGIVATVGLIVMILNINSSSDSYDLYGKVIEASETSTYTSWALCLDQGNMIKLSYKEGGTLVKKDICTGQNDKMIARVSCTQNHDKTYTDTYSNAEQCPKGMSCMKDHNDAAYCG